MRTQEDLPPLGKKRLLCSFTLFGLAQLLPWNIYIKSVPYFRERLAGIDFSESIGSFMASTFTAFNFATMLVLVLLRWDEWVIGIKGRVCLGMSINALLMIITTLLCVSHLRQKSIMISILFTTSLAGSITALLAKGLLGMVAKFPPSMTPSLVAGQAIAGLMVSIANAVATHFKGDSSENITSSIIYFSTGAAVLLLAMAVFLLNDAFSEYFHSKVSSASVDKVGKNPSEEAISFNTVGVVFKRIKWLAIGASVTLCTTISFFATFITAPRVPDPQNHETFLHMYVPFIFILYDSADLIGRWLPAIRILAFHSKSMFLRVAPWIRLVLFIPLFVFLAPVHLGSRQQPKMLLVFPHLKDLLYLIIVALFGLTTGYLTSVVLMHAPSLATSHQSTIICSRVIDDDPRATARAQDKEREMAGSLMGLFLNIGLLSGSLSSFLWRWILT